ncbi:MAG: OmpA family protein [Deltaproteobacteria bacterium]
MSPVISSTGILLILLIAMIGCAKNKVPVAETGAKNPSEATGKYGSDGQPDMKADGREEPLDTPARTESRLAVLEGRTSAPMLPIYFDFDRSFIREDQRKRLEENARYLRKFPAVKIRIEGNCDAMGTGDYNLALGERRAGRAMKYLVSLGIASNRISVISYGEERLLVEGQAEASMAKNRRDDFVILP